MDMQMKDPGKGITIMGGISEMELRTMSQGEGYGLFLRRFLQQECDSGCENSEFVHFSCRTN